MKTNREIKMDLLKEFAVTSDPKSVSFCREAYKFLTEDEPKGKAADIEMTPERLPDGIYVVYDGDFVSRFDKNCEKEGIKAVGIVQYGHAFGVGLKDKGKFPLVKDYEKCPESHPFYRDRECDAMFDWECVERTKHIQEVGTDIPLEDGEYIPSLPMLVAMCHYADKGLNEALELAGGEPLDMDEEYWSSTENSRGHARYVYFGNGLAGNYNKYYGIVVRPVTAFPIKAQAL